MNKTHYEYYKSGANAQVSLVDNEFAFRDIKLKPRIFGLPQQVSLASTIMRTKIQSPICIASTSFHKVAHQVGEVATAKAAQSQH